MRHILIITEAIGIACLCICLQAKAQQQKYVLTDKYLSKKAEIAPNQYARLHFKNINSVTYYYNESLRKQILKAKKNEDYDRLLGLLEEYVSNFGCENFSRDYELLWMLGQLYEKKGRMEEAKEAYRLVLKNTDDQVEYIRQYYTKLTADEQDEYVPIKYYYELVDYRKQVDTLRPPRGVFLNMGEAINSEYEDYGPALNISNDMLMFSSKRNRRIIRGEELFNEDIYWSVQEEDGWRNAEPFEGINTEFNEGSPCISRDGKTLFFVRCEAPDGYGNCDIYVADLIADGTWGNIRNLGSEVNSPGWDSHPSLSHSQDTLFFASDREGGFGSTDIYYTVRQKNGKWSRALNLGPVINTSKAELSPFYHPVYNVLYFSSNGHLLNFGNFDIFKAYYSDGRWTEPKNIGPLVNGPGEEFYFTIDSEARNLFYARSEQKDFKNLDLFSFPLPMEAQPAATTVFAGSLRDSATGTPFKGIVSIIDLDEGIEVAPKFIRPDGTFSFDLIADNKYLLVIQGDNFFRIEKIFELHNDTVMDLKAPAINMVRIEFETIEFALNSWEIRPEMYPALNKIRDFMLDNPGFNLKISGHTDSQGNPEANNILSQKRADAIKEYLVKKGSVAEHRITAIGYGSSRPIVKEEKTDADRKLNRRVEFEIIRSDNSKPVDWGKL
ncbi:MAG: hypothetical protein KatS3mg031_0039 [Chitinophagales bacterium]|nr:MAG: hypothetical protein KatS3mg031_0039 [Chitinophagales bacterium]